MQRFTGKLQQPVAERVVVGLSWTPGWPEVRCCCGSLPHENGLTDHEILSILMLAGCGLPFGRPGRGAICVTSLVLSSSSLSFTRKRVSCGTELDRNRNSHQ